MATVRKGQAPAPMGRDAFHRVFLDNFKDPSFAPLAGQLDAVEDAAWNNYTLERKAPMTDRAGPGYADPDYQLSAEWRATHERLLVAQAKHDDPGGRHRILVINGAARNDGSCPGEISKTWRLSQLAREVLMTEGAEVDLLDLSLLTSTYDLHIHPCKGCLCTAQPLCHWPCSCYPNHSLHQVNDWMADIYEKWVLAHGIIICTPVYWYSMPSTLKLMIDRLVCADGGNPDPTSTHGKNAEEAKALELAGWPYPKHLADRVYGVVVHGDVGGAESTRRALCDWMDWMGLVDGGSFATLDRYVGYYEPYATSHEALDADTGVQEEVRNMARAVLKGVVAMRSGQLRHYDRELHAPRPK